MAAMMPRGLGSAASAARAVSGLAGRSRARARAASTLASSFEVSGIGLHSGASTHVRLHPSNTRGIFFRRVDQPGAQPIEASIAAVVSTTLSTALGDGTLTVATVEHLMAALCGLGVRSCTIEVDGPELPLLDGSAALWVDAIRAAGLVPQQHDSEADGHALRLTRPVRVEDGGSWAIALPAASPRLTVGIDFAQHRAIGRQWASWAPAPLSTTASSAAAHSFASSSSAASFAAEVAPARTFALAEQLELMREQGLIKGGSLDNALVCDATTGWLNDSGLRYANEPSRHKLLDLMGDLALLPAHALPCCHVVAFKAGHKLHVELARSIVESVERSTCGRHDGDDAVACS